MKTEYRPSSKMLIPFDQAMAIVAHHTPRIDAEIVPLLHAFGRIAAEDIYALDCHPRYDMSAMDGYAIADVDIAANIRSLAIGDDIAAGSVEPPMSVPGVASPISTGAPVPSGCNAVVPVERGLVKDGKVWLDGPAQAGANIRRRGEDTASGDKVVASGSRINPAIMAALATCGVEAILAYRRPQIALFTTGDELGSTIGNANAPMIVGAIAELGLLSPHHTQLGDDSFAIAEAIRSASEVDMSDIIISTGGVSVGAHDHVLDAIHQLNAVVHFHGVAMRPGKPVLFATLPNGSLFFGLPGNPVAALVGFRFLVSQAIRSMFGLAPERGATVPQPRGTKSGLMVFQKAVFSSSSNAEPVILEGQESHKLRPLISADCWVASDGERGAQAYPLDGAFHSCQNV